MICSWRAPATLIWPAGACDADLAGGLHKQVHDGLLPVPGYGTVEVRSGLQSLVSDSTAMAETYAGKEVLWELMWHREFQKELATSRSK